MMCDTVLCFPLNCARDVQIFGCQNWSLGHSLKNDLGDADKSKSTFCNCTEDVNFFPYFSKNVTLLAEKPAIIV